MKKKEKSYSIIIVSDALSTNKEFVVTTKMIRKALIGFLIMFLFFGVAIFDYLTSAYDKEKLKRLEDEISQKELLISDLSSQVTSLNRSLKHMESITKKILVVSGLQSPYALKEVGSGGGPIQNVDLSGSEISIDPNAPANDLVGQAAELNNKFKKLESTLKFVRSVIDEQKVRLASTPSIWPTRGYLTDGYGYRRHPFTGKRDFHHGIDIATQLGNKVMTPANGTVLVAENRGYYGKLVIVDHGYGYTTWYGHLADYNVKEGDQVKRGQVIAFVGSTGRSNAPHLHYEVRVFGKPQNPINFIID
jgi:murein DD-endopeptidase MepM/ murein hydrolase activator NlpD